MTLGAERLPSWLRTALINAPCPARNEDSNQVTVVATEGVDLKLERDCKLTVLY